MSIFDFDGIMPFNINEINVKPLNMSCVYRLNRVSMITHHLFPLIKHKCRKKSSGICIDHLHTSVFSPQYYAQIGIYLMIAIVPIGEESKERERGNSFVKKSQSDTNHNSMSIE